MIAVTVNSDSSTNMTDSISSAQPDDIVPEHLPVAAGDDVDRETTQYVHDDADYCAHDTDGRVVVGVTRGEGQDGDSEVLLLTDADGDHAILPNDHVENGDWQAVARKTVANSTGLSIDCDDVALVRAVDHRVEGEDEIRERTHHVLFHATPTAETPAPACDEDGWTAEWVAEVPAVFDDESGDVRDDIARFLD